MMSLCPKPTCQDNFFQVIVHSQRPPTASRRFFRANLSCRMKGLLSALVRQRDTHRGVVCVEYYSHRASHRVSNNRSAVRALAFRRRSQFPRFHTVITVYGGREGTRSVRVDRCRPRDYTRGRSSWESARDPPRTVRR